MLSESTRRLPRTDPIRTGRPERCAKWRDRRKLNIDEHPAVAERYDVRSTLLVFKGSKVVDQIVGARPRGQIEAQACCCHFVAA